MPKPIQVRSRELREHALRSPSSLGDRTLPAEGLDTTVSATALVNHARWIAACPFEGCLGAELVTPHDPRFFCSECRNASVGYRPVQVEFPANVREIEETLAARPTPATRNWLPGEDADELRAENAEHGVSQ